MFRNAELTNGQNSVRGLTVFISHVLFARLAANFSGSKFPRLSGIMLFFKHAQFQSLLGDDFLQRPGFLSQILTSLLVAARAVSPASLRLPASRNSFDQL
jgi:hypothetical protein